MLTLTVIIKRTKYFLSPFATDWLAISAALFMTGPKSVGPARETLSKALAYAIIIPWMPSTCKRQKHMIIKLFQYGNKGKIEFSISTSQ